MVCITNLLGRNMENNLRKKSASVLSILLFTIAIMLSGNVLSAAGEKATVDQLNAVVTTQAATDTEQNTTITTLEAAITTLNSVNLSQQTALDKAQQDIADLRALIENYHPKKIGDHFGGGIIFYVDKTGQHGLIAARSDSSDGVDNFLQWHNGVIKTTGATGDGIGAGASNTSIIVAAQAADNATGIFAAKVANDYSIQDDGVSPCTGTPDEICHGDWYLPSKHELNILYQQRAFVGGFNGDVPYWSSTEHADYGAWIQYFGIAFQDVYNKGYQNRVRAVRAF
jgi:hypothetical protein